MTNDYVEATTKLQPSDAPPVARLDNIETKRQQVSRLSAMNTLKYNGKWRDETRATKEDAKSNIRAVAGQLELTDHQQQRALYIYDRLPARFDNGYQTSLLALCVTGIAGAEDGRDYHPNAVHPRARQNTEFAALASEIDVGYTELYSCWSKIEKVIA